MKNAVFFGLFAGILVNVALLGVARAEFGETVEFNVSMQMSKWVHESEDGDLFQDGSNELKQNIAIVFDYCVERFTRRSCSGSWSGTLVLEGVELLANIEVSKVTEGGANKYQMYVGLGFTRNVFGDVDLDIGLGERGALAHAVSFNGQALKKPTADGGHLSFSPRIEIRSKQ